MCVWGGGVQGHWVCCLVVVSVCILVALFCCFCVSRVVFGEIYFCCRINRTWNIWSALLMYVRTCVCVRACVHK